MEELKGILILLALIAGIAVIAIGTILGFIWGFKTLIF